MSYKKRKKAMSLKGDCDMVDLLFLKPSLWIVIGHFMSYAEALDLPLEVTSLNSDRKGTVSVSRTHEEGRAIDFSSVGWTDEEIQGAIVYVQSKAMHLGAYSYSDGLQRAIIHHNYKGQGNHFHLQVSPKLAKILTKEWK